MIRDHGARMDTALRRAGEKFVLHGKVYGEHLFAWFIEQNSYAVSVIARHHALAPFLVNNPGLGREWLVFFGPRLLRQSSLAVVTKAAGLSFLAEVIEQILAATVADLRIHPHLLELA